MIFKKPYAFLIKNFRIIHLILTFFIGFLLAKTYDIYNFFSRYVRNVYSTLSDATPTNYITFFMFIIVILVVSFSLSMYFLMRKKEKPKVFYISAAAYYTFYLIFLLGYFMLFRSIEIGSSPINIRDAMVYRDVTLVILLPQIIFLVFSLIRGIGFDIKKFNFSKDLKELDVIDEDSEEFEFVLGVDSYKYFRSLRRKIREFKYYVLENKIMFTILSTFVGVVLTIVFMLNFTVFNKTYGKNQKFTANNLTMKVNNSYITDVDYAGKVIEKNKYFLILNMTFKNTTGNSTVLDLTNYVLKTKSGNVLPTVSRNKYFVDLGAGYSKEKIEAGNSSDYILVYEINKKDIANKYKLNVLDEVAYGAGTIHSKVKNISLKPLSYHKNQTTKEGKIGEEITFYETSLGNSALTVESYDFKNKFTYNYEACTVSACNSVTDVVTANSKNSKKLLVLKGKMSLDKESTFYRNKKTALTFFDAFVTLKYDNKITTVINATPKSVTDYYILQVDEDAQKAKSLELIITVRNKKYTISLKKG